MYITMGAESLWHDDDDEWELRNVTIPTAMNKKQISYGIQRDQFSWTNFSR